MPEAAPVTALLGPTNTGKTHRAIERMLGYDTGMIGLPLRLLAREVYDRITARLGESRVALVTGEEKRIPRSPSYWVCTVEAMPIGHEVDFLAVDEIQLAAHDQRGHVFTERLLHARGLRETWFMGADTMRSALGELLPAARIQEHPRLSKLTGTGTTKLSRLPPRSAVVAFSMQEVYETAERLRALRGGAAVVLGALSPRTRNAQVAMFQSGEVDTLVATDAIGMGLNLDVHHVAFTSLRKFDGREVRPLEPPEMAQIAGRAGRYQTDGTFGAVAPVQIPPGVSLAIEAHHFAPVRRLRWRNADLDLGSLEALLASLGARPRSRWLELANDAEDTAALRKLVEDPAVRARARGEEAVKLLWEVCRVPDFRKLLFESHVALLKELFVQLTGPRSRIDPDWMAARVAEIDVGSADIDTLLMRIASIRTFTYIAHQGSWVDDAAGWQAKTRAVEDQLSDALHERLVQRFVERGHRRGRAVGTAGGVAAGSGAQSRGESATRAGAQGRGPEGGSGAGKTQGGTGAREAADRAHPFARLLEMRAALAPQAAEPEGSSVDRWVEAVVEAPPERFQVSASGRISVDLGAEHADAEHADAGHVAGHVTGHVTGRVAEHVAGKDTARPLGQLARGTSLLLPEVRLKGLEALGPGARTRLLRRLLACARDLVEDLFAPLRAPEARDLGPAGRGILYQVEQGLGTALTARASEQLAELTARDREVLGALGVVLGEQLLYVPALLRPQAVERRVALCSAWFEGRARPPCPQAGAVSLPVPPGADARAFVAVGYPIYGPRALRADVAERVYQALTASGDLPVPPDLARWMGCPAREVGRVAAALVGGAPGLAGGDAGGAQGRPPAPSR
ncbi:helicase-related protein [Chondromyces apiculatus]|uniref:ATP-dependent DNA helicase n=1 Tax=Chondromyces apiculatus DSM 436 TaxID=1192034 RepID=A0A017THZ2_9BACT|nr:helicase-related protein [Chondromyces apiculatus]EYF08497.1 ATP-dependent DNA helicase [Chondromyces apiculatus DSM 436]